jgi:hypothetical protein
MKRQQVAKMIIAVSFVMLVLAILIVWRPVAVEGNLQPAEPGVGPAQVTGFLLYGEYTGDVQLEGIYTGVHSDALEPEPVELGSLDLALTLEQAGDNVSGYVLLENTLIFTQEHTLPGGRPVGPQVHGTFDGTTLSLVSEKFERTMSAGRTLPQDGRVLPERKVTRQFSLVSNDVASPGATLVGVYRETMWGLTPEPVTVVGSFSVQRPDFLPAVAMRIYLPLIVKGN